jgi:hypothetical protein
MMKYLVITVVALLVVIGGMYVFMRGTAGMRRARGEATAHREYIDKHYPGKKVTVTCSPDDSDGDGYLSCDLTSNEDDNCPVREEIECQYALIGATGCKRRIPSMLQK